VSSKQFVPPPPHPHPLVHVEARAEVKWAAGCGPEGQAQGWRTAGDQSALAAAAQGSLARATGPVWHAER